MMKLSIGRLATRPLSLEHRGAVYPRTVRAAEEPVQVVGPCVTGKQDTRPGVADPICEEPPEEVEQEINSNSG